MPTVTFSSASSGTWTAPLNAASTAYVECWGAGGGGGDFASPGGGGGGGGGEYAREPALAITGNHTYNYTVGAGGAGGTSAAGSAGGNSTFTGNSVTVTAHGGSGGGYSTSGGAGGAGGTGSSNTVHSNGGAGVTAGTDPSGDSYGGGGGSSGSASGAGITGTEWVGAGQPGYPPTNGGIGGNGTVIQSGTTFSGSSGGAPGGGGGGQVAATGCVSPDTEILTAERGWLKYDQACEGMHAWAVDTATGQEVWSLITRVRIYDFPHQVFRVLADGYDCVATESHGHLVHAPDGYHVVKTPELEQDGLALRGEHDLLPDYTVTEYGEVPRVWCPTTQHGNWLARRNGTVFYTGNKP